MTSTSPAAGTRATPGDPRVAPSRPRDRGRITAALSTIRRNIATFGGAYPDDTTVDDRYLQRPADGRHPAGRQSRLDHELLHRDAVARVGAHRRGRRVPRRRRSVDAADFARRVRAERGPRHARPRLPLHPLVGRRLAAARRRGRPRGRAARRRSPDAPVPGARRHHPGLGRSVGSRAARPHDHRQPDEHAAARHGRASRPARSASPTPSRRHTAQLREHILREDDSTFHTFYWDAETGEPLRGATEQGAFDESCWARGQAWGIYGFAMNYAVTGDERAARGRVALRRVLPAPPAGRPGAVLGPRLHRRQRRPSRQLGRGHRGVRSARARQGRDDPMRAARAAGRPGRTASSRRSSRTTRRRRPRTRTRCSCTACTTCPRATASTRARSGATTSTSRR